MDEATDGRISISRLRLATIGAVIGLMCGCTGGFGGLAASNLLENRLVPTPMSSSLGPSPLGDATIVIAVIDISAGAVIEQHMVSSFPYPMDYLVETMLTDPNRALGMRARTDIPRGVPVTSGMLGEPDTAGAIGSEGFALPRDAEVILALVRIPVGTIIEPDMIGAFPYPSEYIIEVMITNADEAIGKRTTFDIPRGAFVSRIFLAEP